MQHLKLKDIKIRKRFFKLENFLKTYQFLFIYLKSNKTLLCDKNKTFSTSFFKLLKKFQKTSKIKIKSRCVMSNRGKSVSKHFGLSRIYLREFLQFGIISGYTKAVW